MHIVIRVAGFEHLLFEVNYFLVLFFDWIFVGLLNTHKDSFLTVFKMNVKGKLNFFVLFLAYGCVIHANEIVTMDMLLPCVTSCLNALRCKWVVYLEESRQCLSQDSLDCHLNGTKIFKRIESEQTLGGTKFRQSTFELQNAKDELC